MWQNIGIAERFARLALGLITIGVSIFLNNIGIYSQFIIGLVGLEVFLTGCFGWSPLYQLFNYSSVNERINSHIGYG